MARPTKYNRVNLQQLEKLCKLGATDQQIADFYEVNRDTIDEWKRKHKEFSDTIARAKLIADAEVADALYKRATGYSHKETIVQLVQKTGQVVKTEIDKNYPADTNAAFIWLKNRQRALWKDRHEFDINQLSEEQVNQLYMEMQQLLRTKVNELPAPSWITSKD